MIYLHLHFKMVEDNLYNATFPQQKLPLSKKDDQWQHDHADDYRRRSGRRRSCRQRHDRGSRRTRRAHRTAAPGAAAEHRNACLARPAARGSGWLVVWQAALRRAAPTQLVSSIGHTWVEPIARPRCDADHRMRAGCIDSRFVRRELLLYLAPYALREQHFSSTQRSTPSCLKSHKSSRGCSSK